MEIILTRDRCCTHTRVISHVRRHLRSTPRHFTLRRVCCSFEIYEIGCASPLTGSAAKRRDEFSPVCHFFLHPSSLSLSLSLYVCMYVFVYSLLFNFLVKDDLTVYGLIPEWISHSLSGRFRRFV